MCTRKYVRWCVQSCNALVYHIPCQNGLYTHMYTHRGSDYTCLSIIPPGLYTHMHTHLGCIHICICTWAVYTYAYAHGLYTHMHTHSGRMGCIHIFIHTYQHICVYVNMCVRVCMGWLRLVGSLKLQVSFAEHRLFYRALLQKRPILLRSLLIVATKYSRNMSIHHVSY